MGDREGMRFGCLCLRGSLKADLCGLSAGVSVNIACVCVILCAGVLSTTVLRKYFHLYVEDRRVNVLCSGRVFVSVCFNTYICKCYNLLLLVLKHFSIKKAR